MYIYIYTYTYIRCIPDVHEKIYIVIIPSSFIPVWDEMQKMSQEGV